MRRFLFGSKRRKLLSILATFVLLTGTAIAAFVIYSGVQGSGSGAFSAAQQAGAAVNITASFPDIDGPGASVGASANVTNLDPGLAHSVTAISAAFSSTPSSCAAHLSFAPVDALPWAVPAAATVNKFVSVTAGAGIPNECAGGSYTLALTGVTSP